MMKDADLFSTQVDGEFKSRTTSTAIAFSHPLWKRLGHAPPPPRPFGWFGGIVAVNADRVVRDSYISTHLRGQMRASERS